MIGDLSLDLARADIAAWIEDYNGKRPPSPVEYEFPLAFTAELQKQWSSPLPLRPPLRNPVQFCPAALLRAGHAFQSATNWRTAGNP